MRLPLRLFCWLIWGLWLTGCGSDYSVLPGKPTPDQKEEPAKTPQHLRIKRIVYEGTWGIGTTTEFEYGSNGKVSEARYVGHDVGNGAPKGLFAYTAGNQLASYEYRYPVADSQGQTGEQTAFSYLLKDNGPGQPKSTVLFAQTDAVKTDGTHKLLKHTTSELINDLVSTVRYEAITVGATATVDEYGFSSGNLLTIRTFIGPAQTEAYTFDDKPNPFFGLFGPDVTPVRRYSRNNVTGATLRYPSGNVQTYTISYTYNEQGLPIIAQPSGTSARLRFEYEAY